MTLLGREYHPALLTADTTDLQAGTLTRMTRALGLGAPAAAISGALSIYNTFLDYGGADLVDTEAAVRRFAGDEVGDYYAENKSAVDIVGFVGTSLLPMSVGIKGLQLARSGATLGGFGKALGYTQSRSNFWLQKALKETAESGGAVRGILESSARRKQLAWTVADQALVGGVAELAILATMNDSPIFDDYSLTDFAWNAGLGIGLSGAIGGTLAGVAAKGILKTAGKQIQSELRLVDTIFDPQSMGLSKGTEIAAYLDGILTRPDGLESLGFKYVYNGKWQHVPGGLDISGAVKTARDNATRLGEQQLAIKFNELAGNNAHIGQAFSQFVINAIDASRAAGKSPDDIVDLLHGYLENVSRIDGVNLQQLATDSRKFYVNLKPTGDTALDKLANSFTSTRTATTSKQAYIMKDGVTADDLVIVHQSELGLEKLKDMFKAAPGADAIQLADGTLRFHPNSTRVKRYKDEPHRIRMFMDVETGTLAPQTVPVIGDVIVPGKLINSLDYFSTGQWRANMPARAATAIDSAPIEGSARFAWVSGRGVQDLLKITGGKLDADDIPMLQRLLELEKTTSYETLRRFRIVERNAEVAYEDLVSLQQYVENRRLELLRTQLDSLGNNPKATIPETRIIAANLGTSREWVEEAIANGFMPPKKAQVLQTAESMRPQSIMMEWNFGMVPKMLPEDAYKMNMGPSHLATKELSRQYQVTTRMNVARNAVAASLGSDAELIINLEQFAIRGRSAAQTADAEGAGASLLGASNANYGDNARLAVQELGKNIALLTTRRRDAVVESLAAHVNALRNNVEASAELGILTTALRKSPHRYVFDPDDSSRLISQEAVAFAKKNNLTVDEAIEVLEAQAGAQARTRSPHSFTIQNAETQEFLRAHSDIVSTRTDKLVPLWNAMGLTKKLPTEPVIYVPPIDTVRYPYHAFVRTKQKVGLGSDLTMITAKSEEQLRALASQVGDDFDVIYKGDTANYFKAKGEYDYGMTLNEAAVNSELARKGVLADFFPETRLENIMEDYLRYHARQEEKHLRVAAQVANPEFFSEMRFLSDQYRKVSESVTRSIGSRFKSKVSDPFGDYIKTALNISKQQEFPLLDSLNDFVDNVGRAAGNALEKARRDAQSGIISYEEANRIADDYGLGMPYKNIDSYIEANERYPRNLIREGFQKANLWLATATLRLDVANSLVNIISTPIMLGTELSSIKRMLGAGDPLIGKLNELMSLPVPGKNGARMPGTTHLLGNSISNWFGADKANLIKRYRDIGAIKDVSQLYHEILDDLSFNSTIAPKQWIERVSKAVERGATLTGNNFSEEFTRFVSADVMRQITDPIVQVGRMSVKEQNAYISTFVNRVQGNYTTSQRPVLFQGTTGAAISLFQTYAFNVLQQLHRHMQAGDKKTLAVFAGLQSSIFGLNGLPFFDATNTHLIGGMLRGNPEHKDAYNVLPAFNKELGDWMLYGTASAMPLFTGSAPALFTRGDINPRHLTIVPTNPLDVPAVSASLKLFDAVYSTGKSIVAGADVSDAMLQGLQHQGWNRPLAGFAQLLAGRSTTSNGSLISAANDMENTAYLAALAERTVSYGGVARLLGARPMDEAVALNTLYRQKSYQAMDRARIERLGQVVKTKLYNNEAPTDEELEDFMLRYTRSGGRIENFSQAMQRWQRDANVSIINQMANRMNSSYGQTLQSIMGGEPISDYRTLD
jgi:hypothetical protein